jgi:hypothetical protein
LKETETGRARRDKVWFVYGQKVRNHSRLGRRAQVYEWSQASNARRDRFGLYTSRFNASRDGAGGSCTSKRFEVTLGSAGRHKLSNEVKRVMRAGTGLFGN